MPRELTPNDDELADPEASYSGGSQHGAAAVLQLIAGKLEPQDARRISRLVGADLRNWRILGHEVVDSPRPPAPPELVQKAPAGANSPLRRSS
jgi:hypothetical protein